MKRLLTGILAILTIGCIPNPNGAPASTSPEAYDWHLPAGVPQPVVPADNPMTVAKVELGRRLFYDKRLSLNGTQSCASCHDQAKAFTDGKPHAVGSTGENTPRGSMSIVNTAYAGALNWGNPVLKRLENQSLLPLTGEKPTELGFLGKEDELEARLRADADYQARFAAVFPGDSPSLTVPNLVKALGAFERSIVSFDSPFDQYQRGDKTAVSESAIRGRDLFMSERLSCNHCHSGYTFSAAEVYRGSTPVERPFFNTGLYNLDGQGSYPEGGKGVYDVTLNAADMGAFKPPTLRNIALTAPYFHDGSAATLDEVIDHYAAGGRTISSGPHAGIGSQNPLKSPLVTGFSLTASEKTDLIAFLESLTDRNVLTNPAWHDPFTAH